MFSTYQRHLINLTFLHWAILFFISNSSPVQDQFHFSDSSQVPSATFAIDHGEFSSRFLLSNKPPRIFDTWLFLLELFLNNLHIASPSPSCSPSSFTEIFLNFPCHSKAFAYSIVPKHKAVHNLGFVLKNADNLKKSNLNPVIRTYYFLHRDS